jgi:ParB-like nuclease domain
MRRLLAALPLGTLFSVATVILSVGQTTSLSRLRDKTMVRRVDLRIVDIAVIDDIVVDERALKSIDWKQVDEIAKSIEKIGMQVPITLRYVPSPDGEGTDVHLVAGLHRLEAHKKLGREVIDCYFEEDWDDSKARLWEISENLHRSELNQIERGEHIEKWMQLCAGEAVEGVSVQVAPKLSVRGREGEGRPESGVRKAARDMNMTRAALLRPLSLRPDPLGFVSDFDFWATCTEIKSPSSAAQSCPPPQTCATCTALRRGGGSRWVCKLHRQR